MKTMKRIDSSKTLLILSLLACGCSDSSASEKPTETASASDVEEEMSEAWDALRAYGYERRVELSELLSTEVDDLKEDIEELKDEASDGAEDAAAGAEVAWEETLDELEEERRLLAARVDRLATASEETWHELRENVSEAYMRFEERLALAEEKE